MSARQMYPQSDQIVQQLETIFASAAHLELNLKSYSWNVIDPRFTELHTFYCEASKIVECQKTRIATRLRAFDQPVPVLPSEILSRSVLKDNVGVFAGNEQLQNLMRDGTTLCRTVQESLKVVHKAQDSTTCEILSEFDEELGKLGWKVRAHLGISGGKQSGVASSGAMPSSAQQKTTTA